MHWLIQNNLYLDNGQRNLVKFLETMEIPFTEFEFTKKETLEESMDPYINPEGLVMAIGSVNFAHVSSKVGWVPGSFYNANHDYQEWKKHFGNHLLNADAIVCSYDEVVQTWDEFFIRPCGDTKSFVGQVMDWVEFSDWKRRVYLGEVNKTLYADTMVMYCQPKKIYREARFFIVDKRIVTYSTYKIGERVIHVAETPPTMIEYAERMINIWQPARAFVLDIALTDDADDGYNKIIEINCLNCSGFYDCDIQKLVMAIEGMKFS